jgi:hypothetical protein
VDLPEVQIVRPETPQRVLELPHRDLAVAAVRAYLRHQEHAIAAIRDGLTHARLAQAVAVVPGVVEEGDTRINRRVRQAHRRAIGLRHAEVPAAEAEDRHALAAAAEGTGRNVAGISQGDATPILRRVHRRHKPTGRRERAAPMADIGYCSQHARRCDVRVLAPGVPPHVTRWP